MLSALYGSARALVSLGARAGPSRALHAAASKRPLPVPPTTGAYLSPISPPDGIPTPTAEKIPNPEALLKKAGHNLTEHLPKLGDDLTWDGLFQLTGPQLESKGWPVKDRKCVDNVAEDTVDGALTLGIVDICFGSCSAFGEYILRTRISELSIHVLLSAQRLGAPFVKEKRPKKKFRGYASLCSSFATFSISYLAFS
jgi:hypothetical protein